MYQDVGAYESAHVAAVFPLVGIKNHEQLAQHWKWKGRIVLGGHNVRSTRGDKITMFQDTASSPSTMTAARAGLAFHALTPGAIALQSDCPNAYIQSEYKGPLTYVRLPREWWPPSWTGMRDPVCRLLRNLYGHPTSGNGWQKHLEEKLFALGYESIDDWPSAYWHPVHKSYMLVYVDDLLGIGPEKELREGFKSLSEVVEIDPPEEISKYLGCEHHIRYKGAGEQRMTTTTFSMDAYCRDACNQFIEETGIRLGKARSPYAPDLDREQLEKLEEAPGKWGDLAAHFLMKLLYAARMCRPDLITAITKLASRIARWNGDCDRRITRVY